MRGYAQSAQQPTNAAVAPDDDSFSEPDVLAFGSSATVSDDLRRALLKEIEEIDHGISKTKKSIASEQSIQQALAKDHHHALKETAGLQREATLTADQLKIGAKILQDVEATIDNEISVVLGAFHESNGEHQAPSSSASAQPHNNKSIAFLRHIKREREAALQKCIATCRVSLAAMQEQLVEIKALKEETKTTEETVETYALRLTELQQINGQRETVLVDETLRLNNLKLSLTENKKKEVDTEGELEGLRQALAEKQQIINSVQAASEQEIAEIKALIAKQQDKLKDMDTLIADTNARKENIATQVEHYQELKKKRDEHKTAVETHRAERNVLFTQKEELGVTLSTIKNNLDQHVRSIHKSEKFVEEEIEPMKQENDRMEAENIGKETDYEHLCQVLEEYKALAKSFEEDKDKLKLEEETEQMIAVKEDTHVKLQAFKKELDETEALLAQVREDKSAYESAVAELEQVHADADTAQLEIRNLQAEASQQARHGAQLVVLQHKYKILHEGAIMLKKTSRIEKEVEKNPFLDPTYF